MFGELNDREIDALLETRRYGRLGYSLDGEIYIVPINYAWANGILYGHATKGSQFAGNATYGTKVRGIRQNDRVAFEVDEIDDPTRWRSVLLHGRVVELTDRQAKQEAFARIVAQGGGGERSEVTWAIDLDHLVMFKIEVTQRTGRFEEREASALQPGRTGPLPPATHVPYTQAVGAKAEPPS
ncbi:MAG TPA: pyridoxamine 5'-phosphate oxidase family protein [Dehalococcoidia bacterium]|nr:pyridoxamine 5'-phosphate oxidase family protein [Dehalococcoidia bacterium]